MRQSDPSIWLRSTGRNPLMTAQHETQHAVDQPAGFLRNIGGDPDWFANRNPNDPLWQFYQNELRKPGIDPKYYWDQMAAREATEFQRYRRSIHEVMARNAEKREALYNLTHDMGGPEMAQRSLRKMMPQETEEVPRAMQLIGKQIPYRKGGRAKRALAMVKRAA